MGGARGGLSQQRRCDWQRLPARGGADSGAGLLGGGAGAGPACVEPEAETWLAGPGVPGRGRISGGGAERVGAVLGRAGPGAEAARGADS